MESIIDQRTSGLRPKSEFFIWGVLLLGWLLALCLIPDPLPLAAPDWAVRAVRALAGATEPMARAIATIVLRALGLSVIGMLVSMSLSSFRIQLAAPIALLVAPLLAVCCQWMNYGYFPVALQIQLGVASAILGVLIGLSFRKSWLAAGAFVLLAGGFFAWGTSTGISDELDLAARAVGIHVLENASQIPDGDEGFAAVIQKAFTFAEDNSNPADAVRTNKAAILAIGVILGEERVAEVAKRDIDLENLGDIRSLRNRITLRGRNDLSKHFWVSAALTVLSDGARSLSIGIGKELMDATPGGSGFSFVDLTADHAGTLFAAVATSSSDSARNLQKRVRIGMNSNDFCPDIQGLPEGIARELFQSEYGGLGGAETTRLIQEIQRRLKSCRGLLEES